MQVQTRQEAGPGSPSLDRNLSTALESPQMTSGLSLLPSVTPDSSAEERNRPGHGETDFQDGTVTQHDRNLPATPESLQTIPGSSVLPSVTPEPFSGVRSTPGLGETTFGGFDDGPVVESDESDGFPPSPPYEPGGGSLDSQQPVEPQKKPCRTIGETEVSPGSPVRQRRRRRRQTTTTTMTTDKTTDDAYSLSLQHREVENILVDDPVPLPVPDASSEAQQSKMRRGLIQQPLWPVAHDDGNSLSLSPRDVESTPEEDPMHLSVSRKACLEEKHSNLCRGLIQPIAHLLPDLPVEPILSYNTVDNDPIKLIDCTSTICFRLDCYSRQENRSNDDEILLFDRPSVEYQFLDDNKALSTPLNDTGISPVPVGTKEAKEETKRPETHGDIDIFISTMTGSPEISNFEIRTPETALFQAMTRQSTHQTPMNQNPTSWIFRSDFDEANDLDLSSRKFRHHRTSTVRTNASSTPTSPGVASIDSGMSKLVEVNVLQRSEAPVERKLLFGDKTSFFDDDETENSIFLLRDPT